MNDINVVSVISNGEAVGKIALTPAGLCAFEYDADFLQRKQSISPYFLPLTAEVKMARRDPFDGGFGVFNDSLPDGWGNLLLDRYLQKKGIDPNKLTVLQRLSLVGKTGRGSLEYLPDQSVGVGSPYFSDFDKLAADCEKILTTDYSGDSLDILYRYAGSSGGARPKVFISIDGKEWLVKFKASIDPDGVGKKEYDYSLLANKCGVYMPETKLFEGKYFGVRRFDRIEGKKIHTISAAGLVNADYRIPSLDYSILLKVCLDLTKDMAQVYALFRLMVFNIIIGNRDDHAKNFSFQLSDGKWVLSPAYDLLPSSGFNGYHTTTINGKGDPTMADIMVVAQEAGIEKSLASDMIDRILSICRVEKMSMYVPPIK